MKSTDFLELADGHHTPVPNDADERAAWGTAAGAIASRRRGKATQHEAEQQVQQAEATEAEKRSAFNKAFSARLEGRKYMVKF
jgi:hypothetical protein